MRGQKSEVRGQNAGVNSRQKGKRGELEVAALMRRHGIEARRGQQFAGGADSPDVVSPAMPWLHVEVKHVEHLDLAKACAQAARDCGRGASAGQEKTWIVVHRRNRGPWFVTMDSEACSRLLRRVFPAFEFLRPFTAARPITMDAELFFQFLRGLLPPEEKSQPGNITLNNE